MRKSIYAAAAVFLLMLAGGCNNTTGPESGYIADQDDKAAVTIAITGTGIQSRSVLPNAALDDITAWQLWGGKTADPKDLLKEFSDPAGQTLYLEIGTWDFTLEGYKDASLVLRGNITNKNISLEGSNILSFIVAPILEGNGTVTITINLPSGHGITQAKVFKDGLDMDSPITPSGDLIVFEVPYPADDYYFSFQLYKGMDLYGVISELIKVRMNLSSEKTFTLDREDLNIRYVITYHLNNGQLGDGAQNPDYYRRTDAAIILPSPTYAGYTFGGWYNDDEFIGEPRAMIPTLSIGDKDFYAQWMLDSYVITYNLNGGSNHAENPASYTVESPAITLAAPAFAGYTFQGWYDNDDFTGPAVATIPAGSTGAKTFYAKWTLDTYAITYHLNGGDNHAENPASYTVEDSAITLADPNRTDYTFGGWFSDADFTGPAVATIPAGSTGNKTFYARWTLVSYSITYNLNGGSNHAENPAAYTVESPAITLAAPAFAGYTFQGWYDNDDFTGPAVATIPAGSTGAKTFYAKWTLDTYAITYHLNGGDNHAENPASYTVENSVITLAEPSRADYTFGGWFSDADFTGPAVATIPAGSTGNKTFYARWTLVSYSITYNLNGGSNHAENPAAYTVESPAITLATPAFAGYTFGGWYDDNEFTGPAVAIIPAGSTGAKTFYAKWTLDTYAITYHLNGGDNHAENPASYTVENSAITLATPSRADYTFGGWFSDADFIGPAVATIPAGSTGNKTFYARWLVNYSITYELNGGSNNAANPVIYTVESPSIILAEPSRANYAFAGWHSDAGFATPVTGIPAGSTDNKTFYAKWNPGVSVQITLQPQPEDPTLSNVSLFVDDQAQFSAAGTGYASWQWRWNGTAIGDANLDIYTLAANSRPAGVYELSVEVVTDGGQILSARCRVTIKAK